MPVSRPTKLPRWASLSPSTSVVEPPENTAAIPAYAHSTVYHIGDPVMNAGAQWVVTLIAGTGTSASSGPGPTGGPGTLYVDNPGPNQVTFAYVTATPVSKDSGWIPGVQPPAQYFNWLFYLIFTWFQYVNDLNEQDFSATGGSTVGPWTGPHSFRGSVDINAASPFTSTAGTSSGSQGAIVTGDGAAYGLTATGGATGSGIHALGGSNGASTGAGIIATGSPLGNGGHFFGGSGGNTVGVLAFGHGSSAGVQGTGGASGYGGLFSGGSTGGGVWASAGSGGNGSGGTFTGHGSGDGVTAQGGATGNGITATGGATSGIGVQGTGGPGAAGGYFISGTGSPFAALVGAGVLASNAIGVLGVGDGSGAGVYGLGGTNTPGVYGSGDGTAAGVQGVGGSSGGSGVLGTGGAGGAGIVGVGGSGNTHGGLFTGSGTGAGVSCAGGATGPGCSASSSSSSVAAVRAAGSATVSKGVEITQGGLVLSGSSPAAGTNPGFDSAQYQANTVHAKGVVSLSGSGGGGSWDGFNVDPASVTFSASNTIIHVTYTRAIPGVAIPVPSVNFGQINVESSSGSGASFSVSDTTLLAGSQKIDLANGGIALTIRFITI